MSVWAPLLHALLGLALVAAVVAGWVVFDVLRPWFPATAQTNRGKLLNAFTYLTALATVLVVFALLAEDVAARLLGA